MSVKKFVGNKDDSGDIELTQDQAIVQIEVEKTFQCLLVENPSPADIDKMSEIEGVVEARFIGPQITLDRLKSGLKGWPPFKREVVTTSKVVVNYSQETGKLSFLKESSQMEHSLEAIPKEVPVKEEEVVDTSEGKKKVLIIDDSKTIQKLLKKIINSSENLEVMDIADCPSHASEILKENKPDLITLDIHMPEMNGVEFLKKELRFLGIPVVMISSVSINEGPLVMEALSNGATTYIQKPSLDRIEETRSEIIEKLEVLVTRKKHSKVTKPAAKRIGGASRFDHFDGLVAIGSSTGGTQALQEVFSMLPDEIPPIMVVQHIPAVFSNALAERLNKLSPFTVQEAEDGVVIEKNNIYIAPGGKQMKLRRRGQDKVIVITSDPPVNRFIPSVDYFFDSIPGLEIKNLIGVILTGMGADGAAGLLKLKEAGAYTIAQDEESSVVFGMPKKAIELGGACSVVSLGEVAQEVMENFGRVEKKKAS